MILNTTRPTIIAGDIHGNLGVMKQIIKFARESYANCIFVGDYLDSYPNTRKEQAACLDLVKEYHTKPDFTFLKGNHELSYIDPDKYRCSGYSSSFQRDVKPVLNSIEFEDYVIINDSILVTHAGLSNLFLEAYNGYWQEAMNSDEDMLGFISGYLSFGLEDPDHKLYHAGSASGGRQPVGGIYWCRPTKFLPFGKDIVQVFGHTKTDGIVYYSDKRAFGIDCLEFEDSPHQVLMLVPGSVNKMKIINLD